MNTENNKTTVQIVGSFYATFTDDPTDIKFSFVPSASDAGYFGEPFFIIQTTIQPAPDQDQLEGQLWEMVANKLIHSKEAQTSYIVCEWSE